MSTDETLTSADVGNYVSAGVDFEVERPNGDVKNVEQGDDFEIVDIEQPGEADDGTVVIEGDGGNHFHIGYNAFVDNLGDVFQMKGAAPASTPDTLNQVDLNDVEDRVESRFEAEVLDAEDQGDVTRVNVVIEGRSTTDQIAKSLRDFVIERDSKVQVCDKGTGRTSAVYNGRADVMDVSENALDTDDGQERAVESQKGSSEDTRTEQSQEDIERIKNIVNQLVTDMGLQLNGRIEMLADRVVAELRIGPKDGLYKLQAMLDGRGELGRVTLDPQFELDATPNGDSPSETIERAIGKALDVENALA